MMRTLDELEDSLSQDMAWRRTELQSLLSQVRAAKGPSLSCLCRAGVALLYAHWEGFTKHALSQYLHYVARRRLKLVELENCFVAMALNAQMTKSQGMSQMDRVIQMVASVRDKADDRLRIPVANSVDTQSNLNSDLLFELCTSLGLDASPFATKRALIDYSLLRSRNSIAHGEYMEIGKDGYEELHHEVIGMLGTVHRIVVAAAENKIYLKAS
jgi:hypothetical protein